MNSVYLYFWRNIFRIILAKHTSEMSIKFPQQYAVTISVKQRPNFYSNSSDSKICTLSSILPWCIKLYQSVSHTRDSHGNKLQATNTSNTKSTYNIEKL